MRNTWCSLFSYSEPQVDSFCFVRGRWIDRLLIRPTNKQGKIYVTTLQYGLGGEGIDFPYAHTVSAVRDRAQIKGNSGIDTSYDGIL